LHFKRSKWDNARFVRLLFSVGRRSGSVDGAGCDLGTSLI